MPITQSLPPITHQSILHLSDTDEVPRGSWRLAGGQALPVRSACVTGEGTLASTRALTSESLSEMQQQPEDKNQNLFAS